MACEGGKGGRLSPNPFQPAGKKNRGAEVFTKRVKDAWIATTSSLIIPKKECHFPILYPHKMELEEGVRRDGSEITLALNLSHDAWLQDTEKSV